MVSSGRKRGDNAGCALRNDWMIIDRRVYFKCVLERLNYPVKPQSYVLGTLILIYCQSQTIVKIPPRLSDLKQLLSAEQGYHAETRCTSAT